MKRKRMLVILGHPSNDSFCGAVSERYVEAATQAGHEVRLLRLDTLDFDPVCTMAITRSSCLSPI
jgi:putative NADPH-quinone reductase